MAERLTRHWRDKPKPRPKRKGYEMQEQRAANAHGGKLTRGSGCSKRPSQKGDSVSDHFRASSKTTAAKSIRIERAWLREIEAQARATGHVPFLNFGFDPNAAHPNREDWVAHPILVSGHLMKCAIMLMADKVDEAREHAALALGDAS